MIALAIAVGTITGLYFGIFAFFVACEWVAQYLDEDTGLALRACAAWDVMADRFRARWDVICG